AKGRSRGATGPPPRAARAGSFSFESVPMPVWIDGGSIPLVTLQSKDILGRCHALRGRAGGRTRRPAGPRPGRVAKVAQHGGRGRTGAGATAPEAPPAGGVPAHQD